MAEIRIEGLRKAFGEHKVLRDVDLDVSSGRLIAILGASGSGKTTLLRLLCGFERADGGRIALNRQPVCAPGLHVPPERRRIGYVAQEGAQFPHLSVAQNILFGLPRQARRSRRGVRAEALLELVGLPASYATRPPHELSGGEQQRVALARALAPEPQLVLLDEPFSALDAALRIGTRQAVAAALAAAGTTALLVTHDQSEALSMGHRVAVLRQGKLVQVACPESLYRRPLDADLAQFVGEAVLLPGLARAGHVSCALGTLPLASGMPDGAVEVMLRPEQLQLSRSRPTLGGLSARVAGVTFFGAEATVRLYLPAGGDEVELLARVPGHTAPRSGDTVAVTVSGEVVAFASDHSANHSPSEALAPPARRAG